MWPSPRLNSRGAARAGSAVLIGAIVLAPCRAASEVADRTPPPARPAVVAVGPAAASPEQALYLVRSTLLSLDDANRTGNYTVLRDLAAPSFQKAHSAADLALIFSDLRRSGIPLTLIAITQPQFIGDPVIDASRTLQLTGVLPTAHLRFTFDMRFQPVDGDWRLAALSVAAQPPAVPVPTPAPPQAAAKGAAPAAPAGKRR